MAEEIISIGQEETVLIFQSPLGACFVFTGQIGQEIHEDLFSAVAAVLFLSLGRQCET